MEISHQDVIHLFCMPKNGVVSAVGPSGKPLVAQTSGATDGRLI